MSDKVKADKIAAHEVMSTVKSSEVALGQKPTRKADNEKKQAGDTKRPDIRNRDDIDPAESVDRFYRELKTLDDKISYFKSKKRALLQAILAQREKLANPSKALVKASDEELEECFKWPKDKKETRVAKEDQKEKGVTSEAKPAEAEPSVDRGSEENS